MIDICFDKWIDRRLDRWIDSCDQIYGQVGDVNKSGCKDSWMDGWIERQEDREIDGQRDRKID